MAGEGKKREILGSPPFGAPPFGARFFSGFGPPFGAMTHTPDPEIDWPKSVLAKVGQIRMAKVGQICLAKVGLAKVRLAKVGLSPHWAAEPSLVVQMQQGRIQLGPRQVEGLR